MLYFIRVLAVCILAAVARFGKSTAKFCKNKTFQKIKALEESCF